MSTLLRPEKDFLNYTFNFLHARKGETALALKEVSQELRGVGKQEKPEYWAELVQQQVVLSQAAAFVERSLVLAAPYLILASNSALQTYPISEGRVESLQKAQPWSQVYGPTPQGAFETFRTTVSILETLKHFAPAHSDIFQSFQQPQRSLLNIMNNFSQEGEPMIRGALLAQLEYGSYPEVLKDRVVEKFQTEYGDPQALISVLTAWLGRAARNRDFSESWRTTAKILSLLQGIPKLLPQAIRDIGKRTLSSKDRRRADWVKQYQSDPSLLPVAELAGHWRDVKFASDGESTWKLR